MTAGLLPLIWMMGGVSGASSSEDVAAGSMRAGGEAERSETKRGLAGPFLIWIKKGLYFVREGALTRLQRKHLASL